MNETTEPFRPILRTQADLERVWVHLTAPLDFTRHSVWLMSIGVDDRPTPALVELEGHPGPPDPDYLDAVADLAAHLEDGGRWALLLARPGGAGVTDDDRAWARGLLAAFRGAGVATEVVHLATDVAVVPLPWDELADAAA